MGMIYFLYTSEMELNRFGGKECELEFTLVAIEKTEHGKMNI